MGEKTRTPRPRASERWRRDRHPPIGVPGVDGLWTNVLGRQGGRDRIPRKLA